MKSPHVRNAPHGRMEISGAASRNVDAGLVIYFSKAASVNRRRQNFLWMALLAWNDLCHSRSMRKPTSPIRDDPPAGAQAGSAARAVVRTRRPGDRIRPLGCGDKLLSDYFTDRKLDRPLRDWVPLIAVDKWILWVVGMGISQEAACETDKDTSVMLECHRRFDCNK